ncbi:hypothetical protein M3226_15465 [Neobacillus cucumis]|uniref:hypothetical protein n=1 Tax=Neobacillus cucumis TaxID=1740721 RepID=UPI00203EB982|nr:hypothetical protein [Neobacillus cucumis]MCM3727079.1 hypothetical protein [Neobacillus cucumis]
MKREYFCCGCGLFHWLDVDTVDPDTEKIEPVSIQGCPNPNCKRQTPFQTDFQVFAIDTIDWINYSESHQDFIEKIKWSSPKYAPEFAIKIYEKQGIRIET